MKIYLAGPIKGDELAKRRIQFNSAKQLMREHEYIVVDPMEIRPEERGCAGDCVGERDEHTPPGGHARVCYLKSDLVVMLSCDGVALLDGWEDSVGAQMERTVARHCGLDVRRLEGWL